MKPYPIISVVITACDRPVLFKRAFISVVTAAKKLAKPVELIIVNDGKQTLEVDTCLLYTSPSPRDLSTSRMPSSA